MDRNEYKKFIDNHQSEIDRVKKSKWALNFHLMPIIGWLNDPNGLCKINDTYHIYFQYSPDDPNGKTKLWGHITSKDFINFDYHEPVLYPDYRYDEHGVYSGSCFQHDGLNYFYYTGNYKHFDKEYDYIYEGREHNTILVTSKDGYEFSDKKVLLFNKDYPSDISCHVRDPKIIEVNDKFYMVLGARTNDDEGCVLVYESDDLSNWNYHMRLVSNEKFGYMWECPDLFNLNNNYYMICCPQGVEQQGYNYQNIYQCGYFKLDLDLENKTSDLYEFVELDYGFDFYAPQTFDDGKRRILIGWMGLPDIDYTNPSVEDGWQHALTIPRELSVKDGYLYQQPLEELKSLRDEKKTIIDGCLDSTYELAFDCSDVFELKLVDDVMLSYDGKLLKLSMNESGYGRNVRFIEIDDLRNVRIFKDVSSLEIFINDGRYVMTSRVYPKMLEGISYTGSLSNIEYYKLNSIKCKM